MKKLIPVLFVFLTFAAFSQDQEGFQNYDWFQAKYVKFKPGKAAEARRLLQEYLYKANEISGRLVLTFESDMGEWDHIAYLHLKDGPQQLSEPNAGIETKWWNGVVKLAGSEQKAKEIIDAYTECILTEEYTLVRMRNMQNQLSRK